MNYTPDMLQLAKSLHSMNTSQLTIYGQLRGVERETFESDKQLRKRIFSKYVPKPLPSFNSLSDSILDIEENYLW